MLRRLKIALPILAFAAAVMLPMKQASAAPTDARRFRAIAPDDGGAPRVLPAFAKDARVSSATSYSHATPGRLCALRLGRRT